MLSGFTDKEQSDIIDQFIKDPAFFTKIAAHKNIDTIVKVLVKAVVTDAPTYKSIAEEVKKVFKEQKDKDQFNTALSQALRTSLSKEEANKFFLAHKDDQAIEVLGALVSYVSEDTLINVLESSNIAQNANLCLNQLLEQKEINKQTFDKVIDAVIAWAQYTSATQKNGLWSPMEVLASKIIPGKEYSYGKALGCAAGANKPELVKKFILANVSLAWSHKKEPVLRYLFRHNDIEAINILTSDKGLKLLAEGVAAIITSGHSCTEIIKAMNAKLAEKNNLDAFYNELRRLFTETKLFKLTEENVKKVFSIHESDSPNLVLDMFLQYGIISIDDQIKAIKTADDKIAVHASARIHPANLP